MLGTMNMQTALGTGIVCLLLRVMGYPRHFRIALTILIVLDEALR